MADHLTEEEQVEALKRWWNENWLSLVVPIVILLGGYLGWNGWNGYQARQAQVASVQYEELMTLLEVAPGEDVSEENKLSAADVAKTIVDSYPNGMYANLSTFVLAKFAIEAGELEKAATLLRGVVDDGANASIADLAKVRLARVLSAQKKYEDALALVVSAEVSEYKSIMAEVRGDIYVAQGELALARTAYQEALDNLSMEQYARRGLVQVKFDSTATPGSNEEAAQSPEDQGDA